MIVAPDQRSVIISFYNPNDVACGETRQYSIADGTLEQVWTSPGSPRVTCPRLVSTPNGIRLVVTTAVEHMTAEQIARYPNAGCLMWGATPFSQVPPSPVFEG
jgi:sugar lactone lactonase YvrE